MPTTQRPAPVLQVRAIDAATHVQAAFKATARTAVTVLGPNITTGTHTRSAGRIGYVRTYLTITGKENITDLCGHAGTTVTESVDRHQLRPVLLNGAVAMDRIFSTDPGPIRSSTS
jgi:hypothetical protein